jgi:hypothetical protein
MNKMIKNPILISTELKEIFFQLKNDSYFVGLLLKDEIDETILAKNFVNYLSVSIDDPSKISYLSKDRIDKISEEEYWGSSKRFHCKPGSLISKIFNNISSQEVERFSNLFKSISSIKEFTLEVIKGQEIVDLYHQSKYQDPNRGSLGNSCMKYDRCVQYLGIYRDNDNISMLVMKNPNGMVIGRSILWDLDNGDKFMDRIYTISDEEYMYFFKKWAKDNGYFYKTHQGWQNTIQATKDNKEVEVFLEVTLKNVKYDRYPYMDTLKWFNLDTGKLYNHKSDTLNDNSILLISPDGSYTHINALEFDGIDRNWQHQGHLIRVEEHNISTARENLNYSETLGIYLLKTESEYSDEFRDYIYKDNSKNNFELLNVRKSFFDPKKEKSILSSFDRYTRMEIASELEEPVSQIRRNWVENVYQDIETNLDIENNLEEVVENELVADNAESDSPRGQE